MTRGRLLLAILGTAAVAAAADRPDPARVRECTRWCVDSYAQTLTDSISCIDSCSRGYPNEPTVACSKTCVIRHMDDIGAIRRCINECGR